MYKGVQFVVYLICKGLFLHYLIQMLQSDEVIFVFHLYILKPMFFIVYFSILLQFKLVYTVMLWLKWVCNNVFFTFIRWKPATSHPAAL